MWRNFLNYSILFLRPIFSKPFLGDYNAQSKVKLLSFISLAIQDLVLQTVTCICKRIQKCYKKTRSRSTHEQQRNTHACALMSLRCRALLSSSLWRRCFYKAVSNNSSLSSLFHLYFHKWWAWGGGGENTFSDVFLSQYRHILSLWISESIDANRIRTMDMALLRKFIAPPV